MASHHLHFRSCITWAGYTMYIPMPAYHHLLRRLDNEQNAFAAAFLRYLDAYGRVLESYQPYRQMHTGRASIRVAVLRS